MLSKKLPMSQQLVGLSFGHSRDSRIKVLSAIHFPTGKSLHNNSIVYIQRAIPKKGGLIPFAAHGFHFKLFPLGITVPFNVSIPVNLHSGDISCSIMDKSGKTTNTLIFNSKGDRQHVDVNYNQNPNQLYFQLKSISTHLMGQLVDYGRGVLSVNDLVEDMNLTEFSIASSPWFKDSLYNWKFPLKTFFANQTHASDDDFDFDALHEYFTEYLSVVEARLKANGVMIVD